MLGGVYGISIADAIPQEELKGVEKSGKGWRRLEIIIGIEIGGLDPLTGGIPVCEGVGCEPNGYRKKGVGGKSLIYIGLLRRTVKSCDIMCVLLCI